MLSVDTWFRKIETSKNKILSHYYYYSYTLGGIKTLQKEIITRKTDDGEGKEKEVGIMQKNKFIQQRFSNGDTNRGLKTSNKQNDRKQLESFRSNI